MRIDIFPKQGENIAQRVYKLYKLKKDINVDNRMIFYFPLSGIKIYPK